MPSHVPVIVALAVLAPATEPVLAQAMEAYRPDPKPQRRGESDP